MNLTTCFRLQANHAKALGRVWSKQINGVNADCTVQMIPLDKAVQIAAATAPHQLLCLGGRNRQMIKLLNELEKNYSNIFNKRTVYASIRDTGDGSLVSPTDNVAIFTTFDASKGLEKEIVLLFDFTVDYYEIRAAQGGVKYEILRNIFCVAASRAKKALYIVEHEKHQLLTFQQLSTPFDTRKSSETYNISEMFDFKYKESVDKCWDFLECKLLPVDDTSVIPTTSADYNIDLFPCVGIFQEMFYFKQFDYHKAMQQYKSTTEHKWSIVDEVLKLPEPESMVQKTLYITAAMTLHMRYITQVVESFIDDEAMMALHDRLAEEFTPDEAVQIPCNINRPNFKAKGLCDVLREDVVYELKFVQELTHEHYLQLASYMIALDKKRGILWNTRTNEKVEVMIKDKQKFLKCVEKTVNKE